MKRNLLSIIILALLVVNIVLTAIMMISVSSASRKTAALVSDISAVIGLEIDGLPTSERAGSVSMADTAVYNISSELTIPLKAGEDGTSHYAVGNVSLSMDTTKDGYKSYGDEESMASREGLITGIIYDVMGNYTVEDMQTNSGAVRAEILTRIQELFGSDFIYAISFSFLYS